MSGGSYDYIYCRLKEECDGRMYDAEMDDMIRDLAEVLHDLEWWQSADSSEDEYRATLTRFKAKWFKDNREERLKGYIDNQIGIVRNQLYALIGEPTEPKSEWQKDHEILKAYSDGANGVLEEVKEEINNIKYKVCCPVCDNDKCVRGTDSCEAEMWARDKKKSECMEDFDEEEIPKKKTFWIHDMDITFDKELTHEEMEKRFFDALKNAGVIGHRGCPS